MTCGIYCITSKSSQKKYIGQSVNIEQRWKNHLKALSQLKHLNAHLQNSYNKHGAEDFIFEIVCVCEKAELNDNEQKWIDSIPKESLFNIYTKVGKGPDWTDDKRARHKERMKEVCSNESFRKNVSNGMKGIAKSDEARKNMSEAAKKRAPASEESRRKMSESRKKMLAAKRAHKVGL